MLTILLTWIYAFLLSLLFGHLTVSFIARVLGRENAEPPHVTILSLVGLGVITCVAAVFSFFARINWEIHILLLIIALAHAFFARKSLRKYIGYYAQGLKANHLFIPLMLGAVLLLSLLATAIPPAYYDDGLYYLPFMKWINTYAVVPGLGNLHPRLAFNSNWHLLSGVFSLPFLGMGTFNDMNGFLHLLMAIFGLTGLKGLISKEYTVSNALRSVLLIPTHLIVGYFNGPSADVPVIYLIWLIVILFIQKTEKDKLDIFDMKSVLILFFSVWVCTIKLSAFPIALLPLILAWQELRQKKTKHILVMGAIALMIALPWMGRNVMLSGYLFFPFYQIDLFSVDWKVPPELVQEEVRYIEAFAAGETLVKKIPYPELQQMDFRAWFPQWFADLRTANKGIFFLICGLTLFYLFNFLLGISTQSQKYIQRYKGYIFLFLAIYGGIAFWFFKAPDFRFGYAFTVILYLLSFSFLLVQMLASYRYGKYAMVGLMGLVALFYLRPLQIIGTDAYYFAKAGQTDFILKPGQPAALDQETFTTAQGLSIYKATQNDQCWDAPLPCTPFYDMGIRLRDEAGGLAKGFFYREQPDVSYYRELQIHYQQPDKIAKPSRRQQGAEGVSEGHASTD